MEVHVQSENTPTPLTIAVYGNVVSNTMLDWPPMLWILCMSMIATYVHLGTTLFVLEFWFGFLAVYWSILHHNIEVPSSSPCLPAHNSDVRI